MAKATKKTEAKMLKKSIVEKATGKQLRKLTKGRINPIGMKTDAIKEALLKSWVEA